MSSNDPESSTDAKLAAVDTFLRRREKQRRATKRLYLTGAAFGLLVAGLQVLASHGLLPEAGKDAAMSTAAVLFGLANSARA